MKRKLAIKPKELKEQWLGWKVSNPICMHDKYGKEKWRIQWIKGKNDHQTTREANYWAFLLLFLSLSCFCFFFNFFLSFGTLAFFLSFFCFVFLLLFFCFLALCFFLTCFFLSWPLQLKTTIKRKGMHDLNEERKMQQKCTYNYLPTHVYHFKTSTQHKVSTPNLENWLVLKSKPHATLSQPQT